MTGQLWFVEVNIVSGFKAKPVWNMVGTPADTREAARVERDKYKAKFPKGHYRVRRYVMDPRSKG